VEHLPAFLGLAAVVIVLPGQDTVLTIRNTLVGGRRSGVATAAGIASGQLVWAVAASAGLAALLQASEPAFTAVRLAGAAYLVYLGASALWQARRSSGNAQSSASPVVRRASRATAYRQGLVSNLGNPKMAVFFTSLLPQFAPPGRASFAAMLALGFVFAGLTLAWLSAYAAAVARVGSALRRPALRRVLDAAAGVVLIAVGLRLAVEKR
jgi:threonine/homoserine/homoserine lactone efflux protein